MQRLERSEQRSLVRLSVIADRFDLTAAGAVLGELDGPGVGTGLLVHHLADLGLVTTQRFRGRALYSVPRATRRRTEPLLSDGERADAVAGLGRVLLDRFADAPDDGQWLAEVEALLATIMAAVEDLLTVEPEQAARLALIVGRYHRARSSLDSVVDLLAGWTDRVPASHEGRVLMGELVNHLALCGRVQEAGRWTERHDSLTDRLGSACPYQPTELLRSTLASMAGDPETSNALCRLVLAGGARGGGQDPPRPRARMLALWNLGVGLSVLGRLAEAEDCTRQALTLALEIGELSLAADLGGNLVGFAAERDGRAVHARNFLRWFDLPRHDSVLSGCSRLVDPAAWIAADLGRHGDAARLARVVEAAPPTGIVFNPGEAPGDLLKRLRRVAPAAVEEAFRDELLGSADSLALARDVLNDPGLPPQADPAEGATAPPRPTPPVVVPRTALIGPLGALPPEARDQLASAGRTVRLGRGELLPDSHAHLILSGWVGYQMVTAAGETATVDVAGVGELVGDPSPLPGRLAEVVAVTLGPVEAVAVPAALIVELRRRYPPFQEALMDLLVARVRRLAGTVTDALYLPVEHRVASRLADLAGRAGPGRPVALSITQDELATMVGSTRPTISRVLTKMEATGALRRARGRIHVLDVEALRP